MTSYHGWANYETWAVNLWITNDQAEIDYWRDTASDLLRKGSQSKHWTAEESARYCLADEMRTTCEDANPLSEDPGMFSDLLSAAISSVNWDQIAERIIEGVQENIAAQ